MAALSIDKKTAVIGALVEGVSLRATERMTGVSRPTIDKIVLRMGRACDRLMAEHIRGFRPAELQMDELWCFVGKKQNHCRTFADFTDLGDYWMWVALDPQSKLVPHAHVGRRSRQDALEFVMELSRRVGGRIQISTDKLAAYRFAITRAFGDQVDYGQIVKRYKVQTSQDSKYSPPECVSASKRVVLGDPNPDLICTSHVERQNLTVRMQSRRFTRLTNAFSKKAENLRAAVSLHFAHYNFGSSGIRVGHFHSISDLQRGKHEGEDLEPEVLLVA